MTMRGDARLDATYLYPGGLRNRAGAIVRHINDHRRNEVLAVAIALAGLPFVESAHLAVTQGLHHRGNLFTSDRFAAAVGQYAIGREGAGIRVGLTPVEREHIFVGQPLE